MKYELPKVNINGSSRDSLIDQQVQVREAAETLLFRLRQATPHGRDYQTAEPGAYLTAMDQHRAQVKAISEVIERAEAILEHLVEGL